MRALLILFGLILAGTASAQQPPIYPNSDLTPGMIDQSLTPQYLCSHSSQDRRGVTTSLAKKVFKAYGILYDDHSSYEVDHFVPLFLGGVNTCPNNPTCNLWPEGHQADILAMAPWGSETKDVLEGVLYRTMCVKRGGVRRAVKDVQWLREAQSTMMSDWRQAYRRYICNDPVGKTPRALAAC